MTSELSDLLRDLDVAVAKAREAEAAATAATKAANAANAAYAAAADHVRTLHVEVAAKLGNLIDPKVRVGGVSNLTGL